MSTVRWAEARGCLQHLHIALHEVLVQGSELATGIVKREHPDLLQAKLLQETLQPADPLSHCSAEVSLKFLRTARAVSAPLISVVLARKDNGRARFGVWGAYVPSSARSERCCEVHAAGEAAHRQPDTVRVAEGSRPWEGTERSHRSAGRPSAMAVAEYSSRKRWSHQ